MNLRIATAMAAIALFVCSDKAQAQMTVRDDLNRPLLVRTKATRIVTLAPFLTELVYAAGAGDRLVGVASMSDYPPEAVKVPVVATGEKFSLEQVAELRPDLVLAWRDGIRRDDIDRISAFGATVFVAQARSLGDVTRLLKIVGLLTGRDVDAAVSDFEHRLISLRDANAGKPRIKVFVEIWDRPLTTISRTHFISEALEICHADNVFRDYPGLAPTVTWDEVYERNPYVIVSAGSAASLEEFRYNWAVRQGLEAVKKDRLVYVGADSMQRPTPRTLEGIALLCAGLDRVRPQAAVPVVAPARTRRSQYGE